MKKIKSLFATIAMLMCCISVYAEYVKIGDLWYDIIYNDRVAKVISWQDDSKYSGDIVIPETVEYNGEIYGVTSISEYAFQDCSGLTTLTIPSSVTTIASTAFYSCSGLTTIIVDPENKVYDSRNNCNAIIESASNTLVIGCKTTSIPKSITSIGDCAFIGCSNLYSISIPNSVTSIGQSAFSGCTGLTSITIPGSVTSIGGWAFNGSGLYFITIPSSVTSIGKYVFCYCHNLKNITVDTENEVYDSRNNCNAIIKTATNTLISGCNTTSIPNNVTSIDDGAFAGLSGMNSIEIPNSVTNIGYGAFKDNMNLTSINIPKSITSIGEYAFDGCINLASVNIADIGAWCHINFNYSSSNPLRYVKHLYINGQETTNIKIPNDITKIKGYAFANCPILTSVTIPNSVTSIGNEVFARCSSLTSVTIPNSITSIGTCAFAGCSSLNSITCANSVPPVCAEGVFESVPTSTCNLYVPKASVNTYKETSPWSEFLITGADIGEDTGIDDIIKENGTITIYTIDGKQVFNGKVQNASEATQVLPSGVYVVNGKKFVVK